MSAEKYLRVIKEYFELSTTKQEELKAEYLFYKVKDDEIFLDQDFDYLIPLMKSMKMTRLGVNTLLIPVWQNEKCIDNFIRYI